MNTLGYELVAAPVGDNIAASTKVIRFNIKDPKYTGVSSLRELSEEEKSMFASNLMISFGIDRNKYEWLSTDDIDWIKFEWSVNDGNEIRYATIIDECMIYVIFRREGTPIEQGDAQEMDKLVCQIKYRSH